MTSSSGHGGLGFSFQINLWLWFTVLFANFAEAVAEGRGKAQAATLRKARDGDRRQAAGGYFGDRMDRPCRATRLGRATSSWS